MKKIFYSAYLVAVMIFTMSFAFKYRFIFSVGEVLGLIALGLNASLFISEEIDREK